MFLLFLFDFLSQLLLIKKIENFFFLQKFSPNNYTNIIVYYLKHRKFVYKQMKKTSERTKTKVQFTPNLYFPIFVLQLFRSQFISMLLF